MPRLSGRVPTASSLTVSAWPSPVRSMVREPRYQGGSADGVLLEQPDAAIQAVSAAAKE